MCLCARCAFTGNVCVHACGEGNPVRDPWPGQSQTLNTLGTARLRRAVHIIQEILYHLSHNFVRFIDATSKCCSQYACHWNTVYRQLKLLVFNSHVMFQCATSSYVWCYLTFAYPSFLLSTRYFLASFYTKYDPTHFIVNTASLLSVLIPKLPQLHGVRIFGINKY